MFLLTLFVVLSVASCKNSDRESGDQPETMVEIDSTYHAMNPMDLRFDSTEQVMIDSGMADLLDAYRESKGTLPPSLDIGINADHYHYDYLIEQYGPDYNREEW